MDLTNLEQSHDGSEGRNPGDDCSFPPLDRRRCDGRSDPRYPKDNSLGYAAAFLRIIACTT